MQKIIILGLNLDADAYPNAANTVRILKTLDIEVIDCRVKLKDVRLWAISHNKKTSSYINGVQLVFYCIISFITTIFNVIKTKGNVSIYATYPSIITLLLMRILKPIIKNKIICDCYISIWDSKFKDRSNENNFFSKTLKKIESASINTADIIITDTQLNSEYLSRELGIKYNKFLSLPLAINEYSPIKTANKVASSTVNILFIGTFIPLHGTEIISQAIKLVKNTNIHFTIIGNGQTAKDFNQNLPNTTWISDWVSLTTLREFIEDSDICLGIFSGTEKSKRVIPFKTYMYLMAGKCIISQNLYSAPKNCPELPIEAIDPKMPELLAAKIIALSGAPEKRALREQQARKFYREHLSNSIVEKRWKNILSLH